MKRLVMLGLACVLGLNLTAFAGTPEQAINFEAKTSTGKVITLKELRGQVVLLDFWASWCKPCQEEFPFLIDLYRQNKGKNFVVLAINLDEDTAKMYAFLEQKIHSAVPFTIITDPEGKIPNLYKLSHLPTTILIGPDGEIRYRQEGYKSATEDKLTQAVKEALAVAAK